MTPPTLPPFPGQVLTARSQEARVAEHVQLARDTYLMRLECPEIARQIVPGQFLMLRASGLTDPLLGRPFALFDVYEDASGTPQGVDFGYIVVGKLTTLMTSWKPGQTVDIWGPLGNGFPLPASGHLMMVAGGIGQTPFLATTLEALGRKRYGDPPRVPRERPETLTLCYGARSSEYLAGLEQFDMEGLDVRLSTDDGTRGHHGFVTELLEAALADGERPSAIYCCGPEPMMKRTAQIAAKHGIACWLSLETPMACGFGACFSCVVPVRISDTDWDYKRVCVEGPVFPAEKLIL